MLLYAILFILSIIIIIFVVFTALTAHSRRGFVKAPSKISEGEYPIDAVFTWVDSNDEKWSKKKRFFTSGSSKPSSFDLKRYGSDNISQIEIEISVKLLLRNAPWIRNIYIVTDEQTPDFMKKPFKDKHKVHMCSHRNIFSETITPTYNSHAIEANLHNIPGLSEHFLYLNDDFYITNPIKRSHFFSDGVPIYRGFGFLNVKSRFLGRFFKKCICLSNPDSETFIEASGNVAEILNDGILSFRPNHNTSPMTKTMMIDSKNFLESINRYNYYRSRSSNDVPPMHFSSVYALKNHKAFIQNNKTYKVGFTDEFKGKIKENCHEICINYIPNSEKAFNLKRKLLGA